jgi:hypothetical protein
MAELSLSIKVPARRAVLINGFRRRLFREWPGDEFARAGLPK